MEEMIERIKSYKGKPIRIMEVCGTHTMNIAQYGIKQILPPQVELISGPGCPVCVTPTSYFMALYDYVNTYPCIIVTFGDLLKIPFNHTSLQKERSKNWDVRIIYSPMECLKIAEDHPNKLVIFLGIGFETTAPLTALLVLKAKRQEVMNLKIALAHKTILPAIHLLLQDQENNISGLLYPGNVGAIIGSDVFKHISYKYQIKGSVCGFTAEEILKSIYFILYGKELFGNHYEKVVVEQGNVKALEVMEEVFGICDSTWRGLENIKDSGYKFQPTYCAYGIEEGKGKEEVLEESGCICGEILKGKKKPTDCKCFAKQCTPFSPIGPCMVSSEGTCSAAFLTRSNNIMGG